MKKLCVALLLAAPFVAHAADIANGERLFNARCSSCHAVGRTAHGGFGPQLNGIVGRRAGSTGDYVYSPAMARANFVWNEKLLTAFVAAPEKLVPGTKMRFWGLSDQKQVADLISYLRSVPAATVKPAAAFSRSPAAPARP